MCWQLETLFHWLIFFTLYHQTLHFPCRFIFRCKILSSFFLVIKCVCIIVFVNCFSVILIWLSVRAAVVCLSCWLLICCVQAAAVAAMVAQTAPAVLVKVLHSTPAVATLSSSRQATAQTPAHNLLWTTNASRHRKVSRLRPSNVLHLPPLRCITRSKWMLLSDASRAADVTRQN